MHNDKAASKWNLIFDTKKKESERKENELLNHINTVCFRKAMLHYSQE